MLAIILPNSITRFSDDSVGAMKPVIQVADQILLDRITYPRWRSPQYNHVITFSSTDLEVKFPYESASRSILALPGETLEIRQGRIIINNEPLTDSSIQLPENFNQPPITLGPDRYYVISENPDYPNLETFGTIVPRQNIRGQLILRIYPFNRFGFVR